MSNPPPGLGGGGALRGPPPGFGSPSSTASSGRSGDGQGGTAVIVRAQIVFLLTTFTEDSFEKASAEIRTLASTNGPEMYHHFLRRTAVVANSILQVLTQHSQQYKDDPAAPPPNIPTSGQAALAWRLLVTESVRAARDVTLAPHFALIMLSPSPSTPLPLPSLRLFNLPPALLFSLTAFTLASPHVFSPLHPSNDVFRSILRQTFAPTMELLRSPGLPFWSMAVIPNQPPYADDLNLQEARSLILALYPRSSPSGGASSRPATPTNPTSPHASPLNSAQRYILLSSLSIKFSSPAIILQTLSALSPGGPPRTPGSIPLEDILFELGENLTSDEGTVEAVIGRWWGPYILEAEDRHRVVTEEASRSIVGLSEGLQVGRGLDLHGVVKGFCTINSISFAGMVRSFDRPNSVASHPSSLSLLLSLLVVPPQTPIPPLAGLIPADLDAPIWDNMSSLLFILNRLTSLPPDTIPVFTASSAPSPADFSRIIDPPGPKSGMSKAARQQAKEIQGAGLWNALGLIRVLVEACCLADTERQTDEVAAVGRAATELLEKATTFAPELVLVALEKLPRPLPQPASNIQQRLLEMYIGPPNPDANSPELVMHTLYELDSERFLQLLLDYYHEDEGNLGRLLDIALELQILDKFLGSEDLHFALDIAALAANKEYLSFEQWLADAVEVQGPEFLQGIFDFADHKIRLEIEHQYRPESVPALPFILGTDVYSIIIRVIRNASNLGKEDIARFKHLRTDILIIHPRLLNLRPGSKDEQGFSVAKFGKEVITLVDNMYQRMYGGELGLDDVIAEMKRCQKSEDEGDHEVFACALHSLFDEYKFVKVYPQRELTMTGILFGAVIDYRLVKGTPAFVATRYVLDSCKTAPHESLYQFGINALSVLRASLVDFPGLCRSLLGIPALHDSHPQFINDISAALVEREEIDLQGGKKLAFPALRLPILLEEGDDVLLEPEQKKRDAIMFNINQTAPSNFESKSQELANLFENRYSRWFAHYFVEVRVSLEQNRHDVYLQLLDVIGSPVLDKHVLWETLRKAKGLINDEKTTTSASDRLNLKTVALWLGRITLARNKPIKMRDLSLKDMLIQGYDNKRLIVAIPFVCNILAACKESIIFHLPNPWLVAVLGLLVEFYHFAELRLNLKFEIEVLFGKLDVQLESIEPSTLLRTHVPPPEPQPELPNRLELELQRATSEITNGTQRFEAPVDPAFARMRAFESEQAHQAATEEFQRRITALLDNLPASLHFNADYPIFQAPTLQRIAHHAIERAVRDIIHPVMNRSVTIAGISTRDLVQKDFGTERDVARMRQSAHYMVQNLAGNLAVVTCKEPLRISMIQNIRNTLASNGFTEENMPEAMVAGVANDNIDVACSVIRDAAMEKSVMDIDVNLTSQYSARHAHSKTGSRLPFWDGASFGVAISNNALPDALKLRSGGLSAVQLKVYEDFEESARVVPNTNANYGYQQQELLPAELQRGPSPLITDGEAPTQTMPARMSLERFSYLIAEVEGFVANAPVSSLSALPPEHEVGDLIRAVGMIAGSSSNREATTLSISQKVVQLIYKTSNTLGREVYVAMLASLCDISRKVEKEVKQWLIYAEDSRKLDVPVTVTLILAGVLPVAELDAHLASTLMRQSTSEMLNFVADLVRECSLSERAPIPRNGFANCLAALLKSHELGQATPVVERLLSDLRGPRAREPVVEAVSGQDLRQPIDPKQQERLAHYFLEWVKLFRSSKNPDAAFIPYITWVQKDHVLDGDELSSAFYRTAINCAVDLDSVKDGSGSFYGTDALAKFVILVVKHYNNGKNGQSPSIVSSKGYYYNKIITIIAYSLSQRQLEEDFEQRPWCRFYTTLLSELTAIEVALPEVYIMCITRLANSLGWIQPTYSPKFAYGWLSIVSHRSFLPQLLTRREEGWPEFSRCLMWLLRFLCSFVKTDMTPASRAVYQATMRILVVLMHDFPEFLDDYYHTFSTAIPPHCVQLRNIVLAAFPNAIAPLPDYYKRLDQLEGEMQRFPTVRSDFLGSLNSGNIRAAIDQHVRTSVPAADAIVNELNNRIAINSDGQDGHSGVTWNHTLLHAAVFYLGTGCVARKAREAGVALFDVQSPEVGLLAGLALALDAEGQYYMLSAVADQLRYPSAHTLFFISFMLYLFSTCSNLPQDHPASAIPERMSRVLLERVVVHRPHPWGLLVTFIGLLDDETYGFWKQPFVRAEEEIYMLFIKAQRSFGRKVTAGAYGGSI